MMKKDVSGYRLILGYLGIFLVVVGAIILLPLILLTIPPYQEDVKYLFNFLIPSLSSIAAGLILTFLFLFKKEKSQLGKHQDSILLVLVWVAAILISAVPFTMSGQMNFTESVFESASGYATVGLTRLPTAMYDSHIYTFYRAILQFFGGIGLVLIVTSAISDRYGLKLYTAEGHTDKLIPNLSKSARIILTIYIIYIALGTIALRIAGVEWFDAICHSISSVATGGFSSKAGGMNDLGGNSIAIEIITSILMVLGGTNFLLHMLLLSRRFKKFFRDIEIRTAGVIAIIFVPLFVISFAFTINPLTNQTFTFGESVRYGVFTFLTGITTTGYSNLPFSINAIPFPATLILVATNIIGAGMGSTAGGTKLYRIGVSAKGYYWAIRSRLSSKRYIYPTYIWRCGELKEVPKEESTEAFGYILLYIIVLFVGTFFISLFGGFDFGDALFEFSNALSSTGLSNGVTANANNAALWTLTIGMFAGRLEIVVIFFAFYRIIRDILRKETV